jgi:hypothetical protein
VGKSLSVGLALAVMALLLPFTQVAQANHGTRTLEVTPDTEVLTNPEVEADSTVELTATLSAAPNATSGAINIDFEAELGPNDPDAGDTPETPDRTCSIPSGSTACQVSYVADDPGTDQWRVWIDHDGENGVQGGATEADALEGPDEDAEPGQPEPPIIGACTLNPPNGEPDCTDVTAIDVVGLLFPGSVDCDDSGGPDTEHETNPSGGGNASNESYNCLVFDQNGNPLADREPGSPFDGTTIYGEIEGDPNDPDDGTTYDTPDLECTTASNDSDNDCGMTVTQSELPGEGTTNVCFWTTGQGEDISTAGANHCGTEPVGENQSTTGADSHNDLADRTEITWAGRNFAGIDIETETADVTVGEDRTVTATIYDQFGDPFQPGPEGIDVMFEFFQRSPFDEDGNTPGSEDRTCNTGTSTSCSITYSSNEAGLDLFCGWVGDAPALDGNAHNAAGKCNTEGRNDADDEAGTADPPQPANDKIDVGETTWLNENPATVVECTPETNKKLVRTQHRLTCTASTTEPDSGVPNTEIDVEANGANDPDNGNTRGTPDFFCMTNADGVCTIRHGGGNGTKDSGETTYTGWIDADYKDNSTESDNDEARNEGDTAGATPEPDNTDVNQIRWLSGARDVTLKKNANNVRRGEEVKFWGFIEAEEAGKRCEGGQTVKLKQRPAGSNKKWTKRRTAETNDNGKFSFDPPMKIFKDKEFRAVAPKNKGCVFAQSDVKTVSLR